MPPTRVTLEDVARESGTSRALVSLALRDQPRVSPATKARILKAADKLGYRPNGLARNLASRRTETVGVVLNNIHNPVYAEVMDGVDELAAERGYRVLIGTAAQRSRGERDAIDSLLEFRTDGLILVGPRIPASDIERAARDVPIVVVWRGLRSPALDTVMNDEVAGPQLAVQHLVELGHSKIAHIDGGRAASATARSAGYRRAMKEAGLEHEISVISGDDTEAAGIAAAELLLDSGDFPSAIFATNDLVATGAIDRLERAGVRIPADVSIVGYDNTHLSSMQHVALTTINQPRREMGRTALELLLERIDGRQAPKRILASPSLVVRATTGPPRT